MLFASPFLEQGSHVPGAAFACPSDEAAEAAAGFKSFCFGDCSEQCPDETPEEYFQGAIATASFPLFLETRDFLIMLLILIVCTCTPWLRSWWNTELVHSF
jgi:hypothetical protein